MLSVLSLLRVPARSASIHRWSSSLAESARQWISWDPNAATRSDVESMLGAAAAAGDATTSPALEAAFGSRVSFGTAGLRAEMGSGPARMNDLTVIQATQGLIAYLKSCLGEDELKRRGIVIGHDHRARAALDLSSPRFARLAAAVCLEASVPVHFHGRTVCTPLVPFGVDALDGAAGIMVTASHNPGKDNGYKVYWGNGAQIVPPHDSGIAAHILEHLEPWNADYGSAASGDMASSALLSDVTDDLADRCVPLYWFDACYPSAASFGWRPLNLPIRLVALPQDRNLMGPGL